MPKSIDVDFSYYHPINRQQREFHESPARHKLLIGGYGSGKTYPAIHEALFHCFQNSRHEFLVARNTWDSLEQNIEKEFFRVARDANAIKSFKEHNMVLQNDTIVQFRPLTLGREQFKGLNICGYLIDDPDINKYAHTISFLNSRLRNSPRASASRFQTIITANYEGHNWLWKTYMRGKDEGHGDDFVYWVCPTESNPTLPEHFIKDLAETHSKKWMDRFIYCNMDSYAGLVYDEYDPKLHDRDLRWCHGDTTETGNELLKIMAVDVGITDPSVVLKIATDMQNVYFYDEWYQENIRSNVLGQYLTNEKNKENFRAILIDPSSAKRDQITGSSVRQNLQIEHGINTQAANNNILYGIEALKGIMTVRKSGKTHFYVDPIKCPNFVRELETYSWKEPESGQFDDMVYKEQPVDKDNHACDAARYGACHVRKWLRGIMNEDREVQFKLKAKKIWEDRRNKLKMYNESSYRGKVKYDYETLLHIRAHYKNRRNVRFKTQKSACYN